MAPCASLGTGTQSLLHIRNTSAKVQRTHPLKRDVAFCAVRSVLSAICPMGHHKRFLLIAYLSAPERTNRTPGNRRDRETTVAAGEDIKEERKLLCHSVFFTVLPLLKKKTRLHWRHTTSLSPSLYICVGVHRNEVASIQLHGVCRN